MTKSKVYSFSTDNPKLIKKLDAIIADKTINKSQLIAITLIEAWGVK